MKYELSRDIPVVKEADVVVAGGGPGGLGAAVTAARNGAKTLLVERYGCPGGMAVMGEVHPFMPNHIDGKPLDGPVYTDWIKKIQQYEDGQGRPVYINKASAMLAAEDLLLEAGVEILYHHTLADTVVEDGQIKALVLHSKSGFSAVKARICIDCTGDADMAALSGCETEQGGPSGHCQPMTLCFKLSHVDKRACLEESGGQRGLKSIVNAYYEEAQKKGEIDCPREDVLFFDWYDEDVLHFNTTRIIHKSGVNGVELSDAEIEGRRQVRQFLAFFRKYIPGFQNCRLHSIAHHIGIRETRRVRGTAYLTRSDYESARKYPDAVARCRYPIDIHNPDGRGTELVHMKEDDWYEIPFGCIVSKDLSNLMIGGRPISVDHAVHSSMRIMPPACSIGQAAGMAAAVCIWKNCSPQVLDGSEIRHLLIEQGALLE